MGRKATLFGAAFGLGVYAIAAYYAWIVRQMPDELFAVQRGDNIYLPAGDYSEAMFCRALKGTQLDCESMTCQHCSLLGAGLTPTVIERPSP